MDKKVLDIVKALSLDEKIALLSGKDFWHLHGLSQYHLPSIMLTDGPHGLRKQAGSSDHVGLSDSVPATCFPTAAALASTWNTDLLTRVGEALGEECRTEAVSVLLGPGANIKRHPLCGRNFEYFSEDPFLSGKLAASFIHGVQSQGIGTSLKHFVANNQETMRMVVDTFIDERTLREIYLKGFEIAVKESQPWTVMSSYNKVNGVYLSEHATLLNEVLAGEWKHEGLVVTDWGANNDRVAGLIAGQALEMPSSGGIHHATLEKALKNKTVTEALLNDRVEHIVALMSKAKDTLEKITEPYNQDSHHRLARQVASEGIVLLKNQDNILPLSKNDTVALIGGFAKKPRYQGSGSSLISPTKLSTAYEAFKAVYKDRLHYAEGYDLDTDDYDAAFIEEALKVAQKADKVVVMIGLTEAYESEGFDRTHLGLPDNHTALIEALVKNHDQVIVTLSNGAPVAMPWKDDVQAIVEQYLGGQASGEALLDVLIGDVNPSGKLAETFPNHLDEFPANQHFPGTHRQVEYREGLYVGYRAYDSMNIEPLYPFGHGLSYTHFEYEQLVLNQETYRKDDHLSLKLDIRNTGNHDGQEIIQVYIGKPNSLVYQPQKALKGFTKVLLKTQEMKTLTIDIPIQSLAIYQDHAYKVERGKYAVYVGASSRDIRLSQTIEVVSDDAVRDDGLTAYKVITPAFAPIKETFESLLGFKIPPPINLKPYHMNTVLSDLKRNIIGKRLYRQVVKQFAAMGGETPNEGTKRMFEKMVDEMPFRAMVNFSSGALSVRRAQGLLDLMNLKLLRGLWKVWRG